MGGGMAWALLPSTLAAGALVLLGLRAHRRRRARHHPQPAQPSFQTAALELIGKTPLIELRCLSRATGCRILGKAEFLNPGGSNKDRIALAIIREAEADGTLLPGGTIVEATAGSTGASLALLCRALGYRCLLVTTDDTSPEKLRLMHALGATVEVVKPAAISDPGHTVNVARRRAAELGHGSIFSNQYENLANMRAHESGTGVEILEQTGGVLDAFVMGSGTGGTLAGVSRVLKQNNPAVRIVLADPNGSALFYKIAHGVMYAPQQQERTRKKNRYDTILEGVGLDRLTANFERAHIDAAHRVMDAEAVLMAQILLREEALFVGGSAAMNCVATVREARRLGPGKTLVTLLCDGGHRYLSSIFSEESVASAHEQMDATGGALKSLQFLMDTGTSVKGNNLYTLGK